MDAENRYMDAQNRYMRVMVDTNILVSAILSSTGRMHTLICYIAAKYSLVLSSYVIDELLEVTRRKFKHKIDAVDTLLCQIPYELVYSPQSPQSGLFDIRDEKDYPVLYSAIASDVDVFITGDKDFDEISVERPEIITATMFWEKY